LDLLKVVGKTFKEYHPKWWLNDDLDHDRKTQKNLLKQTKGLKNHPKNKHKKRKMYIYIYNNSSRCLWSTSSILSILLSLSRLISNNGGELGMTLKVLFSERILAIRNKNNAWMSQEVRI